MKIEIKVLGGIEVTADGRDCTPTAPKVQQVLAMLIARANKVVPATTLTTELWNETPPSSAATTLQTYVYHLRKLFADRGVISDMGEILQTRGTGYLLQVDPAYVDEHNFMCLVEQGRTLLRDGKARPAAVSLRHALAMWEGAPYAGVEAGRLLEGHALLLTEARNDAIQQCIEVELDLGHHRELIGELRMLVAEQPFNEWMHGKLIQALGRAGRRNEALAAYQQMRRILDVELGLDPSEETRQLHEELLRA